MQQIFWHSGNSFLASFLHFFLHLFMDFGAGFFSHFLIFILHGVLSSLRPRQLTSGSGGNGGDGGSGSHKPQVFSHFCFFLGL